MLLLLLPLFINDELPSPSASGDPPFVGTRIVVPEFKCIILFGGGEESIEVPSITTDDQCSLLLSVRLSIIDEPGDTGAPIMC